MLHPVGNVTPTLVIVAPEAKEPERSDENEYEYVCVADTEAGAGVPFQKSDEAVPEPEIVATTVESTVRCCLRAIRPPST